MEKTKRDAIVIGAGGLGREIAATIKGYFDSEYHFLGFIDDGKTKATLVNGAAVLGGLDFLLKDKKELAIFLGIGMPNIKKEIIEKLLKVYDLDKVHFPNLIHPFARLHEASEISLGLGNFIADSVIITTNVSIGNFNLINLSCTIGHDSAIADYCSIMPSVNISGGANLQDSVYVGTGVKLIKSSVLGSNCTIGAGSVVNCDIPRRETWAGVPAYKIK